ncbi:MAG: hypothetical protein NTV51_20270 [Verrucomicrobia bacterium]|nr:hypothetical protein [Verrucomicrobiota bacterium]
MKTPLCPAFAALAFFSVINAVSASADVASVINFLRKNVAGSAPEVTAAQAAAQRGK